MKSGEALRELADVTASQWGMVTAAQAGELGVTRLALSRLTDSGHLERLAHGVYRDAGAPSDQFEDLRAAWLSTEPKLRAEERLRDLADGVVVSSSSAAMLHGIGDLWANRNEFVTSKRRQTQRVEIRYRQRHLDDRDVILVEGLPAMTLERTLADLLDDVGDMSLVAEALGAAAKRRSLDLDRLRELLGPLAERTGFKRHDGNAVLDQLLEIAGLDLESVARRFSEDPVLGSKILDNYLKAAMASGEMPDLSKLTQQLKPLVPEVSADLAQRILEVIRPQIAIDENLWRSLTEASSLKLGNTLSESINTSAVANLSKQWTKDLAVSRPDVGAHGAVNAQQGVEE
ncbi:putative transcriptional regulator of viral defense system [Leucobacter luti]|uniref:type IV toxin-antitoxin system AbiEi family antitoxin domain-containing protein n=1 Tax=Leucobacter luti TaxID=340320 RepID=UPI0010450C02|nr:type IV toxin-antitoxin system AbiEi family antitoxin domain-containing protein [Leucobacter luti]MCW2289123.1 putative transcriptional regulator of viral defense system [Leucobacter luti]TCK35480.1 putative transcriptional regulator of viral defense system [Leucobacter luti]